MKGKGNGGISRILTISKMELYKQLHLRYLAGEECLRYGSDELILK